MLTKSKKIIRLTLVKTAQHTNHFLKVESPAKGMKEQGIKNRLEQGYEQQLHLIKKSLSKPRGIKQVAKVYQRIGRAKQKYPSIHHLYHIHLVIADATQIVKDITWHKDFIKAGDATCRLGVYFLRPNLDNPGEALEWMIYNTIRGIESTFRVLKTDLDLRPVYHQSDDATMAHLHLGLLAYCLVNTIRHQLKQAGIKRRLARGKKKSHHPKNGSYHRTEQLR